MSLLSIAVEGDLERWQRGEADLTRKANLYAVRAGSEKLRSRLAGQTEQSLGARLGKAWKARVYPNWGKAPAAMVYTKAPRIIAAHDAGSVILPKKGRYLAIPTGFNRLGGRRGAKVRVTPKEMVESGAAFTRPRKSGPGLVWFLSVYKAETRSSRIKDGKVLLGKVRQQAFAGGVVKVGRYGRSTRDILAARAVPMFILVPSVHLKKRVDLQRDVDRTRAELPALMQEGYSFYDTGSA